MKATPTKILKMAEADSDVAPAAVLSPLLRFEEKVHSNQNTDYLKTIIAQQTLGAAEYKKLLRQRANVEHLTSAARYASDAMHHSKGVVATLNSTVAQPI